MIVGVCRLIANHLHLTVFESFTRSQGPLLRRRYPVSTLIRPCPTPAVAIACRDAEAATLANNGPPPITRTTFPTCRAHYPGGSSGCTCRLLPRSCSLPPLAGGSASALSLSRPAQALLALRPAGSLSRPRRPLSRGSDPASCPAEPLASFRIQSTIIRVEPSSTDDSRLRGALPEPDSGSAANNVRGILCSDAASGSPPGTDSLSPRAPAACGRVAASGGG